MAARADSAEPDLTLQEIRGRLRARGTIVAASSVWRFCDRHDLTFKKKPARRRTGARGRAYGVDEDELLRIKPRLLLLPVRARRAHVLALLFGGVQAFFLNVRS